MTHGSGGTVTIGGKTVNVGAWSISPAHTEPAAPQSDDLRALLAAAVKSPEEDTPRLIYADELDACAPFGTVLPTPRAELIRVQCELARTPWFLPTTCKVCGNSNDEDGCIEHGRGCYVVDEDGGGSEYPELDDCATCHGTGNVPDTANRDRAEFIHVQVQVARTDYPDLRARESALLAANESRWIDRTWWLENVGRWEWRRGFVSQVAMPHDSFLRNAAVMFAHHPIQVVSLWDTVPANSDSSGRDGWETEEEATAQLSAACVVWGREQARKALGIQANM